MRHPLTRLRMQFNLFKDFITNTIDLITPRSNGQKADLSKAELMSQDQFNFHKLIIVTTRPGKIYALHTTTGEIVWSHFVGSLLPPNTKLSFSHRQPTTLEFHIVKSQFKMGVVVEPEIVVLLRQGKERETIAVNVNALNGKIISTKQLPYTVIDAVVLPKSEQTTRLHPLLLIDERHYVHVLPENNKAMDEFVKKYPQNIHFFIIDAKSDTIKGYVWRPDNERSNRHAIEMWSHVFPDPIVATGRQLSSPENIYSSVRVMEQSATVMHKYLNPHALVVATMRPIRSKNVQDLAAQRLDIFVIDSITGSIIYRTFHSHVTGPVNVALDENVLVYQFTNSAAKRYELAVVELFIDRPMSSFFKNMLRIGGGRVGRPLSAYELPKPFAKRQNYIFPKEAVTVSATKTSHGITSKLFLFGLATNQVMAVNKRLIDARRPQDTPTTDEQEEGLLQYNPYLHYNPLAVISYNRTVQTINGIETSPSHLESTTHVFVHGVDLFYTRVAPAKPFDLLNEDFSYPLLILTLVLTTGLTLFVRSVANKRDVKRQWA